MLGAIFNKGEESGNAQTKQFLKVKIQILLVYFRNPRFDVKEDMAGCAP